MKEIKEIRTIEEIVGYEAYDGTRFADKEECMKYEKLTAEKAIKDKFKKLIVGMIEELDFCDKGPAYLGSGCGEGMGYALVQIKDEADLNICNAYRELIKYHGERTFTEDMIGKEVLVIVTDDYYYSNRESGDWELEECYIYGTIEEQIKIYTDRLNSIKGKFD